VKAFLGGSMRSSRSAGFCAEQERVRGGRRRRLGYTPAAKNIAEAAGLSLYTLIDAESEDWPAFVSMPVLIDDRTIDGVSYSLSFTELRSVDIRDIEKRSVFRKDGTRIGPLGDLVSRMWNEDRIPQEPGVHDGICLGDEATFFESDGRLVPARRRTAA
jgi:hypothetical protein